MGRPATSGIKERKRVNLHISEELDVALERSYIEALGKLGHHIDKTLFRDAVVRTGLDHIEEVVSHLRPRRNGNEST